MTYEIEITRFAPDPVAQRFSAATAEEAARRTQPDNGSEFIVSGTAFAVFVTALDQERTAADLGIFYVWCNADRALVRLDEHREHYATDPHLPAGQNRKTLFRAEDGSVFSVPYEQTVSLDQAMNALHFWLTTEKHILELVWT